MNKSDSRKRLSLQNKKRNVENVKSLWKNLRSRMTNVRSVSVMRNSVKKQKRKLNKMQLTQSKELKISFWRKKRLKLLELERQLAFFKKMLKTTLK